MTRRYTLNAVLALGLVALITVLIVEPGKEPQATAITISAQNPEQIQHLIIKNTRQPTLEFTKENQDWFLQQPFYAPANKNRIRKLLDIVEAKSVAQYNSDSVDLAQMQLNEPFLTLIIDKIPFSFGGNTALGGNRYVKIEHSIHLINDRYSYLARGKATDFVSPALIPDNAVIHQLTLPGLHLYRQDDQWKTNNASTDPDAIQALLTQWKFARALSVSQYTDHNSHQEPDIIIKLDGKIDPIQYTLIESSDEIILLRKDLGLRYHFPIDTGKPLLTLASPAL